MQERPSLSLKRVLSKDEDLELQVLGASPELLLEAPGVVQPGGPRAGEEPPDEAGGGED